MIDTDTGYVLDASALLALINDETGAPNVTRALEHPDTVVSAVNYSEVVAKLISVGIADEVVRTLLHSFSLTVHGFDITQAEQAGFLYATTKKWGLSFGDRACLSLALHLNLPALTADQTWKHVKDVRVKILR